MGSVFLTLYGHFDDVVGAVQLRPTTILHIKHRKVA